MKEGGIQGTSLFKGTSREGRRSLSLLLSLEPHEEKDVLLSLSQTGKKAEDEKEGRKHRKEDLHLSLFLFLSLSFTHNQVYGKKQQSLPSFSVVVSREQTALRLVFG